MMAHTIPHTLLRAHSTATAKAALLLRGGSSHLRCVATPSRSFAQSATRVVRQFKSSLVGGQTTHHVRTRELDHTHTVSIALHSTAPLPLLSCLVYCKYVVQHPTTTPSLLVRMASSIYVINQCAGYGFYTLSVYTSSFARGRW